MTSWLTGLFGFAVIKFGFGIGIIDRLGLCLYDSGGLVITVIIERVLYSVYVYIICNVKIIINKASSVPGMALTRTLLTITSCHPFESVEDTMLFCHRFPFCLQAFDIL